MSRHIDRAHNTAGTSSGIVATTAIVVLASGCLASVLAVSAAAYAYADSVSRREYRIQKRLNQQACIDVRDLVHVKDYFFSGIVHIPEFSCTIED